MATVNRAGEGGDSCRGQSSGLAAEGVILGGMLVRLLVNGRGRSALTVLAAWTGARAAGAAIVGPGAGWAGIVYGAGRVAPLRTPLLTAWVSGVIVGLRGHKAGIHLVRAVVAAAGAATAVAATEAIAPRFGRGVRPQRQIAVVVNVGSGSARAARRALRALRAEPVEIVSVDEVQGQLPDALARAKARLTPGGRLVAAGGDGTIGTALAWGAREGLELAVLPTGTGNDIARSVGIPSIQRKPRQWPPAATSAGWIW